MCSAFEANCNSEKRLIQCEHQNPWTEVNELSSSKSNRLKSAVIDTAEVEKFNRRMCACVSKVQETVKQSENVIMNIQGQWERSHSQEILVLLITL